MTGVFLNCEQPIPMKRFLFLLLLPFIAFTGCEPATFQAVTNVDEYFAYQFSGNTTFSDSTIITSEQVQGWLEEVDKDYLRDLTLESMAIRVIPVTDNESDVVKLSGKAVFNNTEQVLFTSVTTRLSDFASYKSIAPYLNDQEVESFASVLRDFVKGNSSGSIELKIWGESERTGERVDLVMEVYMRFNSIAEVEQNVPGFIGRK